MVGSGACLEELGRHKFTMHLTVSFQNEWLMEGLCPLEINPNAYSENLYADSTNAILSMKMM